MKQMTWQDFLPTAALIVQTEKLLYPGCEGVQCFGRGGGSTSYKRKGTGVHSRTYNLPQGISDLIDENTANASTDPALADQQSNLFSRIMSETASGQAGYEPLTEMAELNPRDYTGFETLQTVARRNPYDSTYEKDTESAYHQRASDALSQVQSGPDAVRGGAARSGIAQGVAADRLAQGRGQEVRQAQLQDVFQATDAAKSAASIENVRASTAVNSALGLERLGGGVDERALGAAKAVDMNKMYNLNMLQLASALKGTALDTQTDNFSGKGDQSNWQAGVSCCFIFLQSLNGMLPWYIEIARFQYWTKSRRDGYTWMASWLVPQMRKRTWVQRIVNAVLVKPFLAYGAWRYGDSRANRASAMLAPYCKGWLAVWSAIGRKVKYGL